MLISYTSNKELCAVFVEEMGSLEFKTKRLIKSYLGKIVGLQGRQTLMTMGGRSAITDVVKSAPLSAAAATEAMLNVFMITDMCMYYRNTVDVFLAAKESWPSRILVSVGKDNTVSKVAPTKRKGSEEAASKKQVV